MVNPFMADHLQLATCQGQNGDFLNTLLPIKYPLATRNAAER